MDTIRLLGRSQSGASAAVIAVVAHPSRAGSPETAHSMYLAALGAAFALFNSARVLAYLPTMWAVMATGDSSQHSLWAWFTLLGGNATMAVWLWENNGRRCNAAIAASVGNSLMCLAIVVVIAWTRL